MTIPPTPEEARELLSYFPARPDYDLWVRTISAIGNTFSEGDALEILLSRFADEKPGETQKKLANGMKDINYATLVYYAKKFGYDPQNATFINRPHGVFRRKGIVKHAPEKPKIINLSKDPCLCYRFADSELRNQIRTLELTAGLSRSDAERHILKENPDAAREREYRISINSNVLNKNLNPNTKRPHGNFKALTFGFRNYFCTVDEIARNIGKGNAIVCGHLSPDFNGNTRRATENHTGADIFAIDIDNKNPETGEVLTDKEGYLSIEKALEMPDTQNALLVYTTPNHTDVWHRYRIIFPLPRLIEGADIYKIIVNRYVNDYGADAQCTDPARAFYGYDCSTIYKIQSGEILKFRNGAQL